MDNTYKSHKLLWLIIIFLVTLVACSSNGTQATTIPENGAANVETPLPASTTVTTDDTNGYPVDTVAGYPAPNPTSSTVSEAYPAPEIVQPLGGSDGSNFEIVRPLKAGDITVSGKGLPNMDIGIVDITFAGTLLGVGKSDQAGLFSITVSALLEKHRIGITIIDATMSMEEIATKYYAYRGEGVENVPNIGFFFDTALVEP